jgi:D-xylonolactonase
MNISSMPAGVEMLQAECVWPVAAELGEGPVWRAGTVWFVDIKGLHVHRYDTASGAKRSYDAPAQPGFILPIADGDFVCGLKTGLHRFDPDTGAFTLFDPVAARDANSRLNDGHVDGAGRLWFGTMDDAETAPTGALYRLDAEGAVAADAPYVITNGPATSPDGKVLYHIDTLKREIYAFDLGAAGALSGKRLFASVEAGFPDGPTVDSEGCVWVALWGGSGLARYDPAGRAVDFVRLPCADVTKAAFGGDDLRTMYITTARKGLSARELADQPLAGALFAVRTAVPGLVQGEIRHGL